MDLGVTALGNWKAQQGGCTHIQVGPLRRCSTAAGAHPTPLFFAVLQRDQRSQVRLLSSPLPWDGRTEENLLTHPPRTPLPLPPPAFCFRVWSFFEKVHELRHGVLQALPPAKPPYGGARCPRIDIIIP